MTKYIAAFVAAIAIAGSARGEQPRADPPLVVNGDITLTSTDFEAYMQVVPEKLRAEFRADAERVKKTVDGLWVQRMVARKAREAGLAGDPIVAARLQQAQEQVLVEAYLLKIEREMKYPDLLPRAREIYQTRINDFKVLGRVHVQHILVDMKCRHRDAALKRAQEIRAEVVAGKEDFKALAKRYSDDGSADKNGGDLGLVQPTVFDEQFRTEIAKLRTAGEVSEPFETRFGFHIVRFIKREPDRTKPFDEVKDDIIAGEKLKVVDAARAQLLAEVRNDPKNFLHLENVEALTNRTGRDAATPPAK